MFFFNMSLPQIQQAFDEYAGYCKATYFREVILLFVFINDKADMIVSFFQEKNTIIESGLNSIVKFVFFSSY